MDVPKSRFKVLALVLSAVVFVFAAVYVDVILRSREAFLEGEKYYGWYRDPAKKTEYFETVFQEDMKQLNVLREKNKLNAEEYQTRAQALEFEKNFQINESSLKYAYQWYKDAYELFSPPQSKWVKLAHQKAPEVLALWKDELRSKNIPFEDYMFE